MSVESFCEYLSACSHDSGIGHKQFVRVYDLVDWVSRDSAIAGRSAAEYALSLAK